MVAGALAAFSAGLVFNGAMLMLNRGFFSLQSNWIPTVVALGNLFLNAVLDFAFYRFGVWGIPLSTAVCNLAGTWALLVLLRRRLRRIEGGAIASTTIRVAVASAVVAAVAWTVWHPLDSALGRSFAGQVGLARHGARGCDRASTSSAAGCCRCGSWRRCSRLRTRLRRA